MKTGSPFFCPQSFCHLLSLLLLVTLADSHATTRAVSLSDCDVCIYGGTSGGVVAAVQAARMGKSVVLLSLIHI